MIRTVFHSIACVALIAAASCVEPTYPPRLPGGEEYASLNTPELLKAPADFPAEVAIATAVPTVDFMFYPGQDYPGKPWSVWGDGLAVNGKYYSSIGDHLAPAGNAFVYEYDPATKKLRRLADVKKALGLPEGHYVPGKIHGRLDAGSDGWIYFSTHRGSTKVTRDQYHYKGDWIMRCDPVTERTEVVAHGPVPKHCIPCSVLDPVRMIFYGGTTSGVGKDGEGVCFFAYDLKAKRLLYSGPDGPSRAMIFAKSTGRIYYTAGKADDDRLMRWDPDQGGAPVNIPGTIGIRAATEETHDGFVYTVSSGQGDKQAQLYRLNTKTEQIEKISPGTTAAAARHGTPVCSPYCIFPRVSGNSG